ncbi:hypothetical protein [Rhizobium sp. BK251]|uniref:hypothetical protein n=1 Tax=Rhizobium sp. BK251 TaxID=2512125 RepID=UPI001046BC84|nr:hypothetical protein [Rhizobium sp. BK251]TCL63616.1 hypothetical protein EV286_11611 [Rhizobium sp. BK251]
MFAPKTDFRSAAARLLAELDLVALDQLNGEYHGERPLSDQQLSLIRAYSKGEIEDLCFEEHLAADPGLARHMGLWRKANFAEFEQDGLSKSAR